MQNIVFFLWDKIYSGLAIQNFERQFVVYIFDNYKVISAFTTVKNKTKSATIKRFW